MPIIELRMKAALRLSNGRLSIGIVTAKLCLYNFYDWDLGAGSVQ